VGLRGTLTNNNTSEKNIGNPREGRQGGRKRTWGMLLAGSVEKKENTRGTPNPQETSGGGGVGPRSVCVERSEGRGTVKRKRFA